tara:strand:+ start:390 stop:662 length:273 start_codon:yes stop_codon:yes gene_type:complete
MMMSKTPTTNTSFRKNIRKPNSYDFTDNLIPLQKPLKDLAISAQDIKESIHKTNNLLSYKILKIEKELSQLTIALKKLTQRIETKSLFKF